MKGSKFFLAVFIASLLFLPAFAAENPTPQSGFMADFIDTLKHVQTSMEKIKSQTRDMKKASADIVTKPVAGLKMAASDLDAAASLMEKYQNAENPIIRETASYTLTVLISLKKINDKIIAQYETLYKIKPADFNRDRFFSDMDKLVAVRDSALNSLFDCSLLATHVLIATGSDKEKEQVFLTISSGERKQLLKKIDASFPAQVKKGLQVGQDYLTASAAAIRQVLAEKIKTADER